MTTAWAWFRADAGRRWPSLAGIALLVAVATATVATALAGARRGDTALARLSARTAPATVAVLPFQSGFDWTRVRALPQVESLATYADTDFRLDGIPAEDLAVAGPPDDADLLRTIERPVLLAGRLADPDRLDEAVVTARFVASYGKGVGDTVTALLPTPEVRAQNTSIEGPDPAGGPRIPLRIVGVIRSPWFTDGPHSGGTLVPSPALLDAYRANLLDEDSWSNALIRLRGGEQALPAFKTALARVTGRSDLDVRNLAEEQRRRQHASAFEARSLLAFGLAALVAAVVLVGQALTRYVGSSIADLRVLRSLGMTRGQTVPAALTGPLLAGGVGGGAGVVLAAVASRWFPIGSAAEAEPAPGLSVDMPVLAAAWLLAVVLVLGGAAVAARLAVGPADPSRQVAAPRHSAIAAAASRAQLPVPVVVGVRYAVEPGRGPEAVPTRPALLGAVVGVLGVVAAVTFSAGVADAADNPARFGQTWQLETWMGFGGTDFTPKDLLRTVARDPDVVAVNDWRAAVATDERTNVAAEVYSFSAVAAPIDVVLISGRMSASATEVVLAPETAELMDAAVGTTVTLRGTRDGVRPMTVTGIGFVPAGSHCTSCSEANGAWVGDGGFDSLFRQFQFHGGFVAVRPGASVEDVAARLDRSALNLGPVPTRFAAPYPPFAAAEIRRVRALPLALGAFLAVLALGAVGHALASAVRRRRHDLAVLRAVGFTRRQCRAVVVTQATALALVGLAFGAPLGVALGRTVWRVVADYTPVFYLPPSSAWALLLIGPVTLLAANLLAVWPGRQAAHLRIGDVLRTE